MVNSKSESLAVVNGSAHAKHKTACSCALALQGRVAMAEPEKMAALKNAYADIILNTAKEAAGRVMAAEKKALGFEEDLCSAKDEALRLLVRLKQMTDAKIIEAEITSSSQQSKIDVLEAQLQEAEGVIVDLRGELTWIRDKLAKAKKTNVQPFDKKTVEDNHLPYGNGLLEWVKISLPSFDQQIGNTSDVQKKILSPRISEDNCCNSVEKGEQLSVSQIESHSSSESDETSVIVRKEWYKNGCTDRMQAMEGDLLVGTLPPSGELDRKIPPNGKELIVTACSKDERQSNELSPKTKSKETVQNFIWKEVRRHGKVCALDRRKVKHSDAPIQLVKHYQQPSILSRCRTYSVNGNAKHGEDSLTLPSIRDGVNVTMNTSSELEAELQHQIFCFIDEKMNAHEEERERKLQNENGVSKRLAAAPDQHFKTCQPSSLPTCCKTYSFPFCSNAKYRGDKSKITENEVKLKPLPRLDPGLTLIRGGVDNRSDSKNVAVVFKGLNRPGTAQNVTDKDTRLVEESVKREQDAAANSIVPCDESNSELAEGLPVHSDLKDAKASEETTIDVPFSDLKDVNKSNEPSLSPSQEDSDRLLKYTFQRKRKKEAFSSPEKNTFHEKNTARRILGEHPSDSLQPQKSSLIHETSRDSRRLAQVARQLISLSGKR